MLIRYLALVALLAAAGCPAPVSPPSELDLNRAKWQAAGLENYEFDFRLGCFCPDEFRRPVHIVVQAGRVVDVRHLEDGSPANVASFGEFTVEHQFARIENAELEGVESVLVTYDAELGYPIETFIHTDPGIADLDFLYSITNLTPR